MAVKKSKFNDDYNAGVVKGNSLILSLINDGSKGGFTDVTKSAHSLHDFYDSVMYKEMATGANSDYMKGVAMALGFYANTKQILKR